MVVGLAVSETLALVVAVPHERLLTLSTHEMLHMPMLPKGGDNSFFDGTPTCTTDRDPHLVMAPEAVYLILIRGNEEE